MNYLVKTGQVFYGLCMITFGINQFIHADFRNVILPPWPSWRENPQMAAYITGVALILAGLAIIFNRKGKDVALFLGGLFLLLFVFWQLPYILFIQPNSMIHLGVWALALKELALGGGALVVAGSFQETGNSAYKFLKPLENLIPYARIFFCITMIAFGYSHFLYTDYVSPMVPAWIPGHTFWTYFGGAALIAAGLAIILKIQLKIVGLLLGTMIFIWFVILHVPSAISKPMVLKGNEVVSAGDALAFSGIAFLIACSVMKTETRQDPGN